MYNLKEKYLKYKYKYKELKKQYGGTLINKTGTESIKNEIYVNYKPDMNIIKNEYALDNVYKIRQIRDKSTDSVVDVLFRYDYNNNNNNNKLRTYKRNFFFNVY